MPGTPAGTDGSQMTALLVGSHTPAASPEAGRQADGTLPPSRAEVWVSAVPQDQRGSALSLPVCTS